MMTIEDVRIYILIAAFVAAGVAIIVYALKNPTGAMKLICMVAVIAMALTAFAFAEAEANFDEVTIIDFRRVEPVLFNNEAVLRICFNYNGELLSWYDTVFLPQMEYRITIFAGEEVIDAEPLYDAVAR
jgi:hypothetical protein